MLQQVESAHTPLDLEGVATTACDKLEYELRRGVEGIENAPARHAGVAAHSVWAKMASRAPNREEFLIPKETHINRRKTPLLGIRIDPPIMSRASHIPKIQQNKRVLGQD